MTERRGQKRPDLKDAATSKSAALTVVKVDCTPYADGGTKADATGGHGVCGRHTVCA